MDATAQDQHDAADPTMIARTLIVSAVRSALSEPDDSLAGINPILEKAGYSPKMVAAAFNDVDDLFVLVARGEALSMCGPLLGLPPRTSDAAQSALINFSIIAWHTYSTIMFRFVRTMMLEAAQRPLLKRRVYEEGLQVVTSTLSKFLADADETGALSIADAQLSAEHLIGMLKEPIYQQLMRHPTEQLNQATNASINANIERFIYGCSTARRAGHELA